MDMQPNFDNQIKDYFTGALSPSDKKAFEQSLKTDAALQEAFRPYKFFDKAIQVVGEQELKTMAQRMATEIGPLPIPQLSFWERLSLFFTQTPSADTSWFKLPQWRIVFSGISTTMACCLLYANILVPSYSEIPIAMGSKAESVSTNGENPKTAFSDSEKLYNDNKITDLEKRAQDDNPIIATAGSYYLAHLYLKNKNYEAAVTAFDKILLLDNIAVLKTEINPSIGTLKVNRLLAILGKNKDKAEVNRLIAALADDPDCRTQKAALDAIYKEVNNPWRFLKFN